MPPVSPYWCCRSAESTVRAPISADVQAETRLRLVDRMRLAKEGQWEMESEANKANTTNQGSHLLWKSSFGLFCCLWRLLLGCLWLLWVSAITLTHVEFKPSNIFGFSERKFLNSKVWKNLLVGSSPCQRWKNVTACLQSWSKSFAKFYAVWLQKLVMLQFCVFWRNT